MDQPSKGQSFPGPPWTSPARGNQHQGHNGQAQQEATKTTVTMDRLSKGHQNTGATMGQPSKGHHTPGGREGAQAAKPNPARGSPSRGSPARACEEPKAQGKPHPLRGSSRLGVDRKRKAAQQGAAQKGTIVSYIVSQQSAIQPGDEERWKSCEAHIGPMAHDR